MAFMQMLDLSGNQLAALPSSVGDLSMLQQLDLTDNNIKVLPKTIGKLTFISSIVLTGNDLSAAEIEKAKKLPNNSSITF